MSTGGAMTRLKLIIAAVCVVIVAVLGFGVYYLNGAMTIGSGYVAKYLCSQIFLAGRDVDGLFEHEIKPVNPLFALIDYQVDQTRQTVFASSFGNWKEIEAVYREGFGCTLAVDTSRQELMNQTKGARALSDPDFTRLWPDGELVDLNLPPGELDTERLNQIITRSFTEPESGQIINTQAVVIVYKGRIVAERYKPPFDESTIMQGWSMSKSVTNALTGILVRDNRLDIMDPAPIDSWRNATDKKAEITIDQLMRMSSGLAFVENYLPFDDVTEMLYNTKSMADYAASRPLESDPDTVWNYSSGSANIVSRIVKNTVGGTLAAFNNFAHSALFEPLSIRSAVFEPDASGSFVGSSYMYATARDWARLGLLFLNDGVWNGKRILPEGWVTYSTTPTPKAPMGQYGAMIWLNRGDRGNPENREFPTLPADLYYFSGHNDQLVMIIPSSQLIIVRLGVTIPSGSWDKEAFAKEVINCIR